MIHKYVTASHFQRQHKYFRSNSWLIGIIIVSCPHQEQVFWVIHDFQKDCQRGTPLKNETSPSPRILVADHVGKGRLSTPPSKPEIWSPGELLPKWFRCLTFTNMQWRRRVLTGVVAIFICPSLARLLLWGQWHAVLLLNVVCGLREWNRTCHSIAAVVCPMHKFES